MKLGILAGALIISTSYPSMHSSMGPINITIAIIYKINDRRRMKIIAVAMSAIVCCMLIAGSQRNLETI